MNHFQGNFYIQLTRRVVAALLAVVLVVPSFPMATFAQTESTDGSDAATEQAAVAEESEPATEEPASEVTKEEEETPAVDETPVVEEAPIVDETPVDEIVPTDDTVSGEQNVEESVDLLSDLADRVIEDLVVPLTPEPSNATYVEKVELGVTYSYEGNDQVQVTFTSLPETPGSLSIEEVTLTDEQVEALGAVSAIAYDITSNMENGSFAYDLKLPVPEGLETVSQVVYAESVDHIEDGVTAVEEENVEVSTSEDTVTVTQLDHFTIFIVTSFEEVQTTDPEVGYNGIWFTNSVDTEVERVSSGTDGIASSVGNFHGKITGYAFTRWDGYKSVFPVGGYDTRVDVYLDMSLASGGADDRFDFSSAISDTSGNHRRDFIFHLGTDPSTDGQWLASASNNAPGWPGNPGNSPVSLTQSGWYTLEHELKDVAGVLEVTLNLYKKGNPTPVGSWVRTDPSDVIGSTVGGNRYGWFIDSDFSWLAIDQAEIEYTTAVGTLEVMSYQCLPGTTVTRAANGVGGIVPATCFPAAGTAFGYVHGTQTDANAPYPELGAPITEAGVSDSNGELSVTLKATGRYLVMETDGAGTQLPADEPLGFYCDGDADTSGTNDNQELTFVPENDATYCVAYNEAPADSTPPSTPILLSPADGSTLGTNEFDFIWQASTDDRPRPITYVFHSSLDGTESGGTLTNGLWTSGELTTPTIHSSGAPDGTWYWQVQAKDEAGNVSGWSDIWTVTLDTDVPPVPAESAILQPTEAEVVMGSTDLEAVYVDQNGDGNDGVQWAVRAGSCTSGTVFGNVDGKNTPFAWDGENFLASIDTTTVDNGEYCFIFNPTEDSGDTNQRLTRLFTIDNPETVPPTAPAIVFPASEQVFTTVPILNDWTEATDDSGIGMYEIAYAYDDGHTFGGSTCPTVTEINSTPVSGCRQTTATERNHSPALSEQGGVTIWVRAFDVPGNVGPWSALVHYYYDVDGSGPVTPTSDTNTEVVTGDTASAENDLGWMFNRDPFTVTFFEFLDGIHQIGEGSLHVAPITNTENGTSDKFIAELFLQSPVAEVDSMSFDFQIDNPSDTVAEHFYMNVYANFGVSDDLKFYDCRYNIVAASGSTSGWTTLSFDPTQSYPVTTRGGAEASPFTCPASPADMDTLSAGSTIRVIAMNIGDTGEGGSDEGVGGYLDNAVLVRTIGSHTQTTIYDFEAEEVTPAPEEEEEGSGGGSGGTRNRVPGGNDNSSQEVEDQVTEQVETVVNNFFGGAAAANAGAGEGDEGGVGGGDDETLQGGDVPPTEENQNALLANVLSALGLDAASSWLLALIAAIIAGLGYGGWFAFRRFKKKQA